MPDVGPLDILYILELAEACILVHADYCLGHVGNYLLLGRGKCLVYNLIDLAEKYNKQLQMV